MHFLTLTVKNFGVFRGRHDFDLSPIAATGEKRPLIVISGHNGAGKSTLFNAIALALHGSLALGTRVSQRAYDEFILSRLHRYHTEGGLAISEQSSVIVGCQFTLSGRPVRVQIERRWTRSGENIREDLLVLRDGESPDVQPEDYQAWIDDLVAPGLGSVLFFDAEQLDTVNSAEQHTALLEDMLSRLLGLDLVTRLRNDLSYYLGQQGGSDQIQELRQEVLGRQAELDEIDTELATLEQRESSLIERQSDLEAELAKEERRLAAEGGSYAARRTVLQERARQVQSEIERYSNQLRDLCAELLPFTLAPELSQALHNRLQEEAQIQKEKAAAQLWQERMAETRAQVQAEELWQGVEVPSQSRNVLMQRLMRILREEKASYTVDQSLVHHLAQTEQEQLRAWINQTLHVTPQQAEKIAAHLRQLKEERRQIERDLHRAPDDELLTPIYEEIERLEGALADVAKALADLEKQRAVVQFRREEKVGERERAADALQAAQKKDRQLDLATRSKIVLRTYQDALTRQRLNMLEEQLVDSFNRVCRKEHLLMEARIDPETFALTLVGKNGRALNPGDFSAGENELFVLSLLQALRQVSQRQLPLLIDTPLARLDEMHRRRLLADYVPDVGEQVILFATDAELDDELLQQSGSQLARIYRLSYSDEEQQTTVRQRAARPTVNLISNNGAAGTGAREKGAAHVS